MENRGIMSVNQITKRLLAEYADYPDIVKQIRELTGDPAKERTFGDVVASFVARGGLETCEKRALDMYPATEWSRAWDESPQNKREWLAGMLEVDCDKLAIARKLGLVGDEAVTEKTQQRVRCFVCGDVCWVAIDRGNGFVGYGFRHTANDTPTRQCAWPADEFDGITEVSIGFIRTEYADTPIIAKLDELLRETGEYVEPQPERGDYVVSPSGFHPDQVYIDVTREEAIQQLRGTAEDFASRGEPVIVSLRPLGPAILTLRSVEKTTWDIEEVPNVQG